MWFLKPPCEVCWEEKAQESLMHLSNMYLLSTVHMPEMQDCQALRAECVLVTKTDMSCPWVGGRVTGSHHEAGTPGKGLDAFFHSLLITNCEKGLINFIL